MSQARRRGTFEERKAQAIEREALRQQAERDARHQRALEAAAKREQREQEEVKAIQTMVWWQFEMSHERYELFQKRKHKRDMANAQMAGMFASLLYQPPFRRFR